MITKSKFISILKQLQQATELQNSVDKLIRDNENITGGLDSGIIVSHETLVIDLLDYIFNQREEESWISYFIYEGEYGKRLESNSVTEEDGTPIDITTAEKLYDFLIDEMKGKN